MKTPLFTPEERTQIRTELLQRAADDTRLSGGAITGSVAVHREDRWSDIDLAFAVADPSELDNVLSDWTTHLYDRHSVVDHYDVRAGAWIYRVFLLQSTLQIDVAFVPAADFRALAPTFRLIFGRANEPRHVSAPALKDVIGLAWLYALHARSCIERGKMWQAEYMVSGVRDNALALACLRHGLPSAHGRGMDQLPSEVTAAFQDSLVRRLDSAEISRAFRVVVSGLLSEIRMADESAAERLEQVLMRISQTGPEVPA